FAILENRKDGISPRTAKLILGLYGDWCGLDERIEAVTSDIEEISRVEATCQRLMSVPGIGPLVSTGLVAAIGTGEAFERGRDFGAWLGLVPRQYSTGGKSILGRISKRAASICARSSSRRPTSSSCVRRPGSGSASEHG